MNPDKSTSGRHSARSGPSPTPVTLFLATLAVFFAFVGQPATAREPIVAGAEIDYPPFSVVDASGRVDGFSIELMRAALAAMGRDVVFRTGPWATVRGWLESGEVEALPVVGRTPEREEVFDFTFPYMSLHGSIVVRAQNTDVFDLDDLRGRSVAVMEGDNAEEFLRRDDYGIDIITTRTFEDALTALAGGEYDAVVVQRLVALRLIEELGLPGLRVIDRPIRDFRQDFCFAVREGDRETLALLNEGLSVVIADETYRQLHAKWFAALELPAKRAIVVGGDKNYPPFEFLDERGRPAGFNVEIMRAVAREMDLDIEFRLGPWNEVLEGVTRGEIDALEGMFYSPERDATFDFTAPHTVSHQVAVVRREAAPAPSRLEELNGLRVVVQNGDIMHDFTVEQGLSDQTTVVQTQEEALARVADGNRDVALVSRLTAYYWMERNNWDHLRVGAKPFASPGYCIAVLDGNDALLASFSEGLQVIKENGTYRRIYEKWMGVYETLPPDPATILRYVALVSGPLLIILLLAVLWSRSLRNQVASRTTELRKSLELQSAMIACSPVALYSCRLDGTVLSWNAGAEMVFGWSAEEVIGVPLKSIPPECSSESDELLRRIREGEVILDIEVVRRKKGGELFDGRLSLSPIRGATGEIVGLMAAMEDITERKRAEQALADSEERYRLLADNTLDVIWTMDRDFVFTYVNPASTLLTGHAPEEIVGTTYSDYCTGAEFDRMKQLIEDRIERGPEPEGVIFESSMIQKDGATVPVEIHGNVIFDATGSPVAIHGSTRDIGDRVRSRRRIEHLNRVLRAIRDVNQLIVRESDTESLIREGSRLLVESRGYTSALIILTDECERTVSWAAAGVAADSERLNDLLCDGDLPSFCSRIAGANAAPVLVEDGAVVEEAGVPHEVGGPTLGARLTHGDENFGYLIAALEHDPGVLDEELVLFSEMANDLSYALHVMRIEASRAASENRRRSLERQLSQAQRMESVGRLAGGVAHDYNNMLGVIIGYAELALEKIDSDDPLYADIEEIRTAAMHSADITSRLLAFARRQTITPIVLDLNRTIASMLNMLRRLIGEDIDISWEPGPDLWSVKLDPAQVNQILTNLCVNARDAITGTGRIVIETGNTALDDAFVSQNPGASPGDHVLLAVSDNGRGMDRETLENAFEPFYSTKDVGKGTGLGLATVYGIVKQNDGFVSVDSEPGAGTVFRIYLPRSRQPTNRDESTGSSGTPEGRGETVLLVEDEPAIMKMGRTVLEELGYTVYAATRPTEAITIASVPGRRIDLLLTDVIMPEMNGRELSLELERTHPGLRTLFMSGYTTDAIAQQGILDEDVRLIQKPFTRAHFAERLREILDAPR